MQKYWREVKHFAHRASIFTRRHWQLILVWVGSVGFLMVGAVLLWGATLSIPDLAALENRRIAQSVEIYDRTGQVLLYDLNRNVDRSVVPLSNISPNIKAATIAIEDPNFYNHRGVEIGAIARAILVDVMTLSRSQGGSTITQQVVKLTLLTANKSITRKLKEWILALKIERTLTKDQILEIYLNQVPYGGPIYGVEAAAEGFFGKSAQDVTLAEAAYLAAVMPAPTYYSPYGQHRDALDSRKNLVLDKMLEHGYINQEQHDEAKAAEVAFLPQRKSSITAPHFVFYVEQYLESKYGKDALDAGGWKVTTTLDVDLQAHAEEIVNRNALANVERFNATNMGLVALDPKNGNILAMVGSRDYFDDAIQGNYNVTLAERQPGSAFKPFAYAEAFVKGYTPDTVVFDVPTQFSTACSANNFTSEGDCYSPGNYDDKFRGPMSLRNALAQSINVPAVKVLYLAGLNDVLSLAKAMGLTTLGDASRYGLTLVLGGGEVSLLEMTSAYGTFAQNGVHNPSVAVLKIEDATGHVIEDNTEPGGIQVLDARAAQQINDVLSDTVARAPLGGGSTFNFPGYDVALKTGTTNDYRDAWTIGYTPSIVVGAWAGNNDNQSMEKRVSGLIVGPAWSEFMHYALTKVPQESFTRVDTDNQNLKPVLRGNWQVPGSDGRIHEILYWVDKDDPTGAPPNNPNNDPQFRLWDPPVVARYGGASYVPSPQPTVPQVQIDPNTGQPYYVLPQPQQQQNNPPPQTGVFQPQYSQTGGAVLPQ